MEEKLDTIFYESDFTLDVKDTKKKYHAYSFQTTTSAGFNVLVPIKTFALAGIATL
jgi:hypothetical protein